ncbi:MAG: cytochrome c [Chromatiales bacterium]|nr:cytochrome c [Chromatiales bacterium]
MASLCLGIALVSPSAATVDPILERGRTVFLTYCAGCHGFDGLAFLPFAPSFAMGERMYKSDYELLRSIRRGRNGMPSWEGKLPDDWLTAALAYIRFMDRAGREGAPVANQVPAYFFLFPTNPGAARPAYLVIPD